MPFGNASPAQPAQPKQERIFKEVPDGKYQAYVNRLKVDTTKSGKPRLSIGFKVASGTMNGEWVWDSCTLDSEKGIEIAIKKLTAVCPDWVEPNGLCNPTYDSIVGIISVECDAIMKHLEETKTALKNITVKRNEKGFVTVYVN